MKRAVLYLSGFDPRGEKFYRRTFRNELRKFSKINSLDCQIDSKQSGKFSAKTNQTETDLFFLSWQNIIDNIYHKPRIIALLATFIGSLVFFTNLKSVRNSNKYILFFIGRTLLDLLILLIGFVCCLVASFNVQLLPLSLICLFVTILVKAYFFLIKKVFDDKLKKWVQGFVALTYFYTKRKTKGFNKQAETHKNVIEELIKKNIYDEVILYAHSAGSIPLVFLLNQLSEKSLKNIKIITVGQCLPSYINIPHFLELKKRMVYLTEKKYLEWYDLYSPLDIVSLRLDRDSDFVKLSSSNAQFYKMYSKEKYSVIKKDLFSLHFHYIICGDNPVNPLNLYYLLTHNKPIKGYKKT